MSYDLTRFITAQEHSYDAALSEIKSGRKRTHWMWYIFPQIEGLGHSATAQFYAISDLQEAKEYYSHPVLGPRLVEISEALLSLEGDNATTVMGYPDDLKLKSSMTLFAIASGNPVFTQVLEKYFDGRQDRYTVKILGL